MPIAPNILARQFDVTAITTTERFWAGDITYVATREGWLYLAVVLDLVSRRIIGWSMRPSMERTLVIDALRSAIANKRPGSMPLFHSDRGSQYASAEFRAVLAANGLTASMSRKGECWDNAVVESFFGTMKTELGDHVWKSRDAAPECVNRFETGFVNKCYAAIGSGGLIKTVSSSAGGSGVPFTKRCGLRAYAVETAA